MNKFRRGFTVLELLVAALLLGMIVTTLTMVFNQSSIAWRTGTAGVSDLDDVRNALARLREEADNLYLWDRGTPYRHLDLWDDRGNLRDRAIDDSRPFGNTVDSDDQASYIRSNEPNGFTPFSTRQRDLSIIAVGNGVGSKRINTYTVNVKSAGPDKEFGTFDDIWSFPDDFD